MKLFLIVLFVPLLRVIFQSALEIKVYLPSAAYFIKCSLFLSPKLLVVSPIYITCHCFSVRCTLGITIGISMSFLVFQLHKFPVLLFQSALCNLFIWWRELKVQNYANTINHFDVTSQTNVSLDFYWYQNVGALLLLGLIGQYFKIFFICNFSLFSFSNRNCPCSSEFRFSFNFF